MNTGIRFECFYCPVLQDGKVVKTTKPVKLFELGDEVHTKTLFYNYGKNFVIYQGYKLFAVENGVLTKIISKEEIKYPLKLVFNYGTQLTIFNEKELDSIKLLMTGEHELEKELGNLFFLSRVYTRKIKTIQYQVMADLTNSFRDYDYVNTTIEEQTSSLIEELQMVEKKFRDLLIAHPDIKEKYLSYMNFGEKEDMFELSINKYCIEGSEQYQQYKAESVVLKAKPIYPKFKLDHLLDYLNN